MIVHEKDRTRVLSVTDGPTLATAESPPTHLLLDSTGEGIYAVNTQGLCTFVNRSAAEMLGYGPRDLIGRNLHDLIHHSRDDGSPYPEEECPIYRAFRAGRGVTVEGEPFWRRDRTSFPTRYSSFPVVDGGEVTGAVVTFSDITERTLDRDALRQAHDELERRVAERTAALSGANLRLESEIAQRERAEAERGRLLDQLESERALLTAVLQQMPSGVVIAEAPSGRLLHYNGEAARLLRHPFIPPSAVHESAFDCAVHPDGRTYLPEEYPIARALRGEVVKEENLRCRHAGSVEAYLSVTSAPIRDASGRIVAAVSTLHDVSHRRQSEVKRAELLRRLVNLQEEERHRIARELHDQMGQHLTAFLLDLEALRGHTSDHPAAAEALQRLRDLADRVGQDVHRIAFELRPTALDDWGLQTALTNYVSDWSQRCRVMAQVQCTGMERRFPSAVETALFRVVQEALTNVLKHAQAGRVSVIVERRDGGVLAIVEDNGRGFDAEAVLGEPDARRRLGLLGMEERVTQLGGSLEIESSPGGGTSLFIHVPLSEAGGVGHD